MRRTLLAATLALLAAQAARADDAVPPFLEPNHEVFKALPAKGTCDAKFDSTYDKKTAALTLCDHGKLVAFKVPIKGPNADVTVVEVRDPVQDYDGDGTQEVLVFRGQCVEGPCLGDHTLMRLERGKLVGVAKLQAELVNPLEDGKKTAFALERYCFNYDFGIGLGYFGVAAFAKDGKLAMIPFGELKARFPKKFGTPTPPEAPKPLDTELFEVQKVIDDAYGAKDVKALERAYAKAVKPLKGQELGVYCEPLKVIRYIATH